VPVQIRPFHRPDRDQLTALVNAHVAAVVPGIQVSVNTLLAQLEREPQEAIVDPWVVERRTLVAIERDAVAAAAHLLRYGDDARVSESYRGSAEIRWLVARPDAAEAADALVRACVDVFDEWEPPRRYADGALPAPLVYGIPENWPHLRGLLTRNGFVHEGRVELVLFAPLAALAAAPRPAGVELARRVGRNGTRLAAVAAGEEIGLVEVEQLTAGGRDPASATWADVGNLAVAEPHRRRGVGRWLVGCAAEWLRLARVDQLAAYATPDEKDALAFLDALGFRRLTRTERGWRLP
jgi:GNAT superfamily N-acetyltransferase